MRLKKKDKITKIKQHILSFTISFMQTAATSQDMSQFTSFLLDDIPTSSDTHVAQQPEAHEPIILQDLLQTLYFVRVDQH